MLLVDRVQHLDDRALQDFVLQRRDPERPSSASGLGMYESNDGFAR